MTVVSFPFFQQIAPLDCEDHFGGGDKSLIVGKREPGERLGFRLSRTEGISETAANFCKMVDFLTVTGNCKQQIAFIEKEGLIFLRSMREVRAGLFAERTRYFTAL